MFLMCIVHWIFWFLGQFFFWCFAATHLARQLNQERTQVVCSNKVARKHLARRHSRNSCHMFVCMVVSACSRHALDWLMIAFITCNSSLVPLLEGLHESATAWLFHVGACQNCVDIFWFWFWIHTASAPNTAGTSTDGGAVIRKPGSAWLEGTSAMDRRINSRRIHM